MTLDDVAREAADAVLERGAQVGPHPAGLRRKSWVAPAAVLGMVLLLVGGGLAVNRVVRSEPEQVVAATVSVTGVQGPMLAAFVDGSGQITVLAGSPSSPEVLHLQANVGPPVLGDERIPEPRWSVDGRVIEYVSLIEGQLQVVRIDVRTGLTSTDLYVARELPLMRGGVGPAVWAADSGDRWRLNTFQDDQARFLSFGSIRFLAPTADGLVALSGGVLRLVAADLEQTELVVEAVTAADVRSVASGPDGELAFGLEDGSVVVASASGEQSIAVGGDPLTGLAWDPLGQSLVAQTAQSAQVCTLASGQCRAAEVVGSLVRGSPVPLAPELLYGLWPESTAPAADAAATSVDAAPWRFDPRLLVLEYASVVLGWPDPVIVEVDAPAFLPYRAAFEVRRSADGPTVGVDATQLAAGAGWLVTGAQSPMARLTTSYWTGGRGPVTLGFSREGAAIVDVTVGIGEMRYQQSTTDPDEVEVEFQVDTSNADPAYYLLLFRDEAGAVFAARSGSFTSAIPPLKVG